MLNNTKTTDTVLWMMAFLVFFLDFGALAYRFRRNNLLYEPEKGAIAHLLAPPGTITVTAIALKHGDMLLAELGGAMIAVLTIYYVIAFRGKRGRPATDKRRKFYC